MNIKRKNKIKSKNNIFSDLIMSVAILVTALSTAAIPWASSSALIGIIFCFQGAADGTVNIGIV